MQPFGTVSTHSRLKAAGQTDAARRPFRCCFNTQPPEGGWDWVIFTFYVSACFNTQPPEGGWSNNHTNPPRRVVSTHSRLKAAGSRRSSCEMRPAVSTHSRLKAAGLLRPFTQLFTVVSTHSRLKAAGRRHRGGKPQNPVSTHSRLKAAGASLKSLAPSGLAAPISLGSQEKREREYNTAFSVTPAFAIS